MQGKLDKAVKNYLEAHKMNSSARHFASQEGTMAVTDVAGFCDFFFSTYKPNDQEMHNGVKTPTDPSVLIYYIIFGIFLLDNGSRKKVSANLKEIFLEYGLDLQLDLVRGDEIIAILKFMSKNFKLCEDARIDVELSNGIDSDSHRRVINMMQIFRDHLPADEQNYLSIKTGCAFNAVSFISSASAKWDVIVSENNVKNCMATLDSDQGYIYVSKDQRSALIVPKKGAILFASADPITTESIIKICEEERNSRGEWLECTLFLPMHDIHHTTVNPSLLERVFKGVEGGMLGGLVSRSGNTLYIKDIRKLDRVGVSASSSVYTVPDGHGSFRVFNSENYHELYLGLLSESSRLFITEMNVVKFVGSCKGIEISSIINGKAIRSCVIQSCSTVYGREAASEKREVPTALDDSLEEVLRRVLLQK